MSIVLPSPPALEATSAFGRSLREGFEGHISEFTLGAEEELMLLDPGTLDLVPESAALLDSAGGDPRFSAELPAAQVELITPVCAGADDLLGALVSARRDLLAAAAGTVRLAGAGTHPFSAAEGAISAGERYAEIATEYQWAARRGLAWGLHIHVAVTGAQRALAVHNALRAHLPQLAALAGNAPFHEGADTGLHSVRPKLAEAFPRQGIPPAFETWEAYADFLNWGARSGAFATDGRQLWWEVRLHPGFGTIEVRVCDQPATAAQSAGLAAVVQALCAQLGEQHDAGELAPPAPRERIEENRWRALRHGLEGSLLDLETGRPVETRASVADLLDDLEPRAATLGSAAAFAGARELLGQTGAERQRRRAAAVGLFGVVDHLAAQLEAEATH
ncbi:MAG: YbdK family carboxylate-amine ligase [Solirubrobacteraceae bacterium]|nr:YbdK family carboxylate-amine ligase [Solirubrobacteraceae bacterium]